MTAESGTVHTLPTAIRPRERDAVIQALRAGVTPRVGLQHIQVGRSGEVAQVIADMGRIAGGGSAVRFVIGDYGAGKTFFLNLARSLALQHKLVVIHADLSPDRRLHATAGQARGLYAELMRNLSTRAKPEGGALASIVERFIAEAEAEARTEKAGVAEVIRRRLASVQDWVGGYDFATVLERYWRAHEAGEEAGKASALRWLRGEYTLKTEARDALGVRSIIDDAGIYDHLKLMSRLVRLAGYDGLLVVLDELVNVYKLVNSQARNANYEQLLRIVNDVLQGSAENVGFYFGGTPEFLMDGRRGVYSYEALRSRLAENSFAGRGSGLVDLSGPVLRLQALTPEELYVLLANLRRVFAGGDPARYLVPDEAFSAFMDHCNQRIGEAYFRTPRNTIKAFLDLLAILEQNPGADWRQLVGATEIKAEQEPNVADVADGEVKGEDDLASFRL